MQRLAKELSGIGWKKSRALSEKFPTMEKLYLATPKEIQEVEGIGKKLAQQIHDELRGK
jgi:excinuclease UvrABC nuclease subunit